jgi:hypothetical protein
MKKYIVKIGKTKLAFFAFNETEAVACAARWWINKHKEPLPVEPVVSICQQWKRQQQGQTELCNAYARALDRLISAI